MFIHNRICTHKDDGTDLLKSPIRWLHVLCQQNSTKTKQTRQKLHIQTHTTSHTL